ncbi:MAG: hypothetical protein ACI8PV_000262 [Dinoroseobacter sp.]|jgi:hypothetical protein
MSTMKIILIGCAVLVVNNLLLLNFLGYFSNQNQARQARQDKTRYQTLNHS